MGELTQISTFCSLITYSFTFLLTLSLSLTINYLCLVFSLLRSTYLYYQKQYKGLGSSKSWITNSSGYQKLPRGIKRCWTYTEERRSNFIKNEYRRPREEQNRKESAYVEEIMDVHGWVCEGVIGSTFDRMKRMKQRTQRDDSTIGRTRGRMNAGGQSVWTLCGWSGEGFLSNARDLQGLVEGKCRRGQDEQGQMWACVK